MTTNLTSLLKQFTDIKVIDKTINSSEYTMLDLSESNHDLLDLDCDNTIDFDNYINLYLKKKMSTVAYGGYNEKRNLYKRSTIFKSTDQNERNIHIGLDLWTKADTPVLAALTGKVHSFKNNLGLGNYGPTIILEHQFEEITFYTLYGHLSKKSIENLRIGDHFIQGSQIATLGDFSVNGNYAPHLHFQIIEDLENNFGDYPGVCSITDLELYLKNCPNPNLLLKII